MLQAGVLLVWLAVENPSTQSAPMAVLKNTAIGIDGAHEERPGTAASIIAAPMDEQLRNQLRKLDEGHTKWLAAQLEQFTTDKQGNLVPRPIEDESRVDQRRAEFGLPTLAEYRAKLERVYKPAPVKESSPP